VWFVLALFSSVVFGMSGFLMKTSSVQRCPVVPLLWGLYLTGTLGFAWWMFYTGDVRLDLSIWIWGWVVGLGSAAGNWLFMKALEEGPASLTSPLVNTNILLIILFSVIVYGEQLSFLESLGVGLLLLAVLLIPIDPDETLAIRNKRWYVLVFMATLLFTFRNGGLKVTDELNLPGTPILFVSYLFGWIWSTVEWVRWRRKGRGHTAGSAQKGFWWGALAGIFSFGGMQLYAAALVDGPASIVAPIFATNSLVVAVLSILLFRERLSKLQTISLILLFAGLIIIRL
jgi:drug/metabolite transporter (DMT)-like permease